MSEIEKQFFKVFGIEPNIDYFVSFTNDKTKIVRCFHLNKEELLYRYKNTKDKLKVLRVDFDYPQITDRILLELICILNKHYSEHYQIASMIVGKNIEEVKKSILNDCIEQSKHKDFKQQVQALFKENN